LTKLSKKKPPSIIVKS